VPDWVEGIGIDADVEIRKSGTEMGTKRTWIGKLIWNSGTAERRPGTESRYAMGLVREFLSSSLD
jgi:hypothetical protein